MDIIQVFKDSKLAYDKKVGACYSAWNGIYKEYE